MTEANFKKFINLIDELRSIAREQEPKIKYTSPAYWFWHNMRILLKYVYCFAKEGRWRPGIIDQK